MEQDQKIYRFNYKIVIEYDGGCFHGWQKQAGLVTVQSELEKALHTALHTDQISALQAAGRTDSGVHALGQVVNFKSDFEIDLRRLRHAVSNILKNRLSVLEACEVPLMFNSLHSAVARQYRYVMLNRPAPAVVDHGKAWHVVYPLDLERMKRDAEALIGQHDCTSFRASGCLSKSSVKNIFNSEVTCEGRHIVYTIRGKGFLKQMVRNIVGTLVELNRDKLEYKTMAEILAAKDRRKAGPTAPAQGLYLERVEY